MRSSKDSLLTVNSDRCPDRGDRTGHRDVRLVNAKFKTKKHVSHRSVHKNININMQNYNRFF